MSENKYQVISRKPGLHSIRGDINNDDEHLDEAKCIEGIIKVGILNVKSISVRREPGSRFKTLNGPEYLKLWKEYALQKKCE